MSRPVGDDDRRTLERLALAEWPEPADARVVSVTVAGNRAQVALSVNGDYGYWTYIQRDDDGWRETASGSAPTMGWDDPSALKWAGQS